MGGGGVGGDAGKISQCGGGGAPPQAPPKGNPGGGVEIGSI